MLLVIDDVTEARAAERGVERERLLAQSIVDTVRDPLVVLEQDMTVVAASRAFLGMFSVPAERLVGSRLSELSDGQWDVPALR
jgi:PAS domain-containing protein